MMRVEIHLLEQSQPITRRAVNAYTKGGMYCILLEGGRVEKYPLVGLFRVVEDYSTQGTPRSQDGAK